MTVPRPPSASWIRRRSTTCYEVHVDGRLVGLANTLQAAGRLAARYGVSGGWVPANGRYEDVWTPKEAA